MIRLYIFSFFFFFNDTATTEIYTLSLHDALPISPWRARPLVQPWLELFRLWPFRVFLIEAEMSVVHGRDLPPDKEERSEEHTSELQSRLHLVCRLLL